MTALIYTAAAAGAAALIFGLILALRAWLVRMTDRRIAAFQNDLITRHTDEVQNIYRQMRGWRHDYHNHIQAMKAHLALGQMDELDQYLNKLDTDLTVVDTVIKTGNIMVDAILNSKLSLIGSKDIPVNARAFVPKSLQISEIDLCVIIGNLLDNAMEACCRINDPAGRFIRVYIGTLKEQLYISVTNASDSPVRRAGRGYLSAKGEGHGFGLLRVDKIADKYGGYVNRQHEQGVFATEVMLPLSHNAVVSE